MTAKRFTHKKNQLGMQFICYDDIEVLLGTFADKDGVNHIVNKLNELSDENEQLRKRVKELELLNDGLNYVLENIRKIDVEIDVGDKE